ncbi:DUF6115 domain-containing protein [Geomicrobium sp. JCM 19038]|uniref:DUF6115 domain-containing protein n=1 Tax=Geomicrobium sp. JCM 19038 TaxID=1460635 RepID=UPI00045F3D29|nr:hypothetical protein [Geomicrobium sp. JCM 19038]GAK07550.1 hypothetical protein JCM19038_1285 [Geomicrobium sp. JCM 19038]
MSTFVVVSLFLHLITIAVIIYLVYTKPKGHTREDVDEIEQLLIRYTNKMKEDNKHVLRVIQNKPSFEEVLQEVTPNYDKQPEEGVISDSKEAKIVQLANEGYKAEYIAKQLEMGTGEVQLLLKLQQNDKISQ